MSADAPGLLYSEHPGDENFQSDADKNDTAQDICLAGKLCAKSFTDAQTRAWYDANPDLFTRYAGDSFPYEEVKQIIEKRMREEVYDSLVQDLLRGPADRP